MSFKILDGKGSGREAEVDVENRLKTRAVTESEFVAASELGDAFSISSGFITLTSANPSAILYVKNNNTLDLVVETVFVTHQISTGGVGGALVSATRNDTGGTLITNAVPGIAQNINFGSAKEFPGLVYAGVEGDTVTGGLPFGGFYQNTEQADFDELRLPGITLPQGSDIAFTVTPAPGNTNLNIAVIARAFYRPTGV